MQKIVMPVSQTVPYLITLACSLEPFPDQVLGIPVHVLEFSLGSCGHDTERRRISTCGVPERLAKLESTVEHFETLFVRAYSSVEA